MEKTISLILGGYPWGASNILPFIITISVPSFFSLTIARGKLSFATLGLGGSSESDKDKLCIVTI
jgi:hypothetical protein